MKYDELSEEQKDALVAQKIMGWQPTPCDGQVDPYMDNYWSCTCGWISKEHIWDGGTGHDKVHPRYSTSMDAAWQVLKQIGTSVNVDKEILTSILFDTTWSDLSTFQVLNILCTWTPDLICKDALYAVGAIDDNDEVVEVQL